MASIILYTQPECPPCTIVKLFLDDRGVQYEEKNIAADMDARQQLQQWKSSSTPTVVIGNEAIAGFDLEKLTSALQKHGL
ncbi:glutaredoxin family protein [Bacillus xiapuensis]|uniref:glutaredoxin family protein n=1 Tax=Bacillus xiapuensis TaxID=2014075 RepID=UPI000C24B767|nr:glutaredoxin family protein [Bacillus xiapuensis]